MGTKFPLKSLPKISNFKVLVAKSLEVEDTYIPFISDGIKIKIQQKFLVALCRTSGVAISPFKKNAIENSFFESIERYVIKKMFYTSSVTVLGMVDFTLFKDKKLKEIINYIEQSFEIYFLELKTEFDISAILCIFLDKVTGKYCSSVAIGKSTEKVCLLCTIQIIRGVDSVEDLRKKEFSFGDYESIIREKGIFCVFNSYLRSSIAPIPNMYFRALSICKTHVKKNKRIKKSVSLDNWYIHLKKIKGMYLMSAQQQLSNDTGILQRKNRF